MPRIARINARVAGLVLPFLIGCASGGVTPSRVRYRPEDLVRIFDSTRAAAEERANEPRIRIITPAVLGASRYVESAFRVNEDAYVAIVAVDYDGFARVVFPESPSESGFVRANTLYKLPTFFAGFGSRPLVSFAGSAFAPPTMPAGNTAGLIYAVASDRPLQLQRLATDDGDWNEWEIERLLWGRSYNGAGYALGHALALTGQEFDTDFSGFTQGQGRPAYTFASLGSQSSCYDNINSGFGQFSQSPYAVAYVEMDGVLYARMAIDHGCAGFLTYRLVPVGPVQRPVPVPADSAGTDSTQAANASRTARAPYVGLPVESGSSAMVDGPLARQGVIGRAGANRADSSFRRPMIDRALRFQPPERIRNEGRIRESGGETAQEERMRERQARREASEEQRRTAPRQESASERPPRPEPVRSEPPRPEPAAVERMAPMAAPSGGQPAERMGKPVKE